MIKGYVVFENTCPEGTRTTGNHEQEIYIVLRNFVQILTNEIINFPAGRQPIASQAFYISGESMHAYILKSERDSLDEVLVHYCVGVRSDKNILCYMFQSLFLNKTLVARISWKINDGHLVLKLLQNFSGCRLCCNHLHNNFISWMSCGYP